MSQHLTYPPVQQLRASILASENGDAAAEPSGLTDAVEAQLFFLGALAPADIVIRRALVAVAQVPNLEELDDHALTQAWVGQVERIVRQFSVSPDSWKEPESVAFLARTARTLGVQDADAPLALEVFHQLDEPHRFGIQVALLRSPLFSYIGRVIGLMGDEDMEIEEPDDALRHWVQRVTQGR